MEYIWGIGAGIAFAIFVAAALSSAFVPIGIDEAFDEKKKKTEQSVKEKRMISYMNWISLSTAIMLWGSLAVYPRMAESPIILFMAFLSMSFSSTISGMTYSRSIRNGIITGLSPLFHGMGALADAWTSKVKFVLVDPKDYRWMLNENEDVRRIIRECLRAQGFHYARRAIFGWKMTVGIPRERTIITKDRIYHKLLLVREGKWLLPPGLSIDDLTSDQTRHALSEALNREVEIRFSAQTGLWIVVPHLGYEGSPESYKPYLDHTSTDTEAQEVMERLQEATGEVYSQVNVERLQEQRR